MRIEQRTSELAKANVSLHREVAEHERAEKLLQELTGQLFHLQDEERQRLARELHDGTAQNLVALAMDFGKIRDAVPEEDINTKQLVNRVGSLLAQSTKEVRTISYLLHPPYFEEVGLPATLRHFVDGFEARSGIQVTLELDPKLGRLEHQLELTIFRVVQEALSNIHRHAGSRTAVIVLIRNTVSVELEIADAGRGIPPEILVGCSSKLVGVGLTGMRERVRLVGGRLEIQSDSSGTRIKAIFPLAALYTRHEVSRSDGADVLSVGAV
jgi:two-component system NarL family sensor kinase